MEAWQMEALKTLLETAITEVEPGKRVYLSSKLYGESRYHLINKKYDGVQVEQVNIEEKWGSRVTLHSDELPALLKTLLTWHLEAVKEALDGKQRVSDDLGDLGEHPF